MSLLYQHPFYLRHVLRKPTVCIERFPLEAAVAPASVRPGVKFVK